jgi:hypothetical protein
MALANCDVSDSFDTRPILLVQPAQVARGDQRQRERNSWELRHA